MNKIPKKTIQRALLYIRTLDNLIKSKQNLISSQQLASATGVTDVQVRKDISNFGKVGKPRIGYNTKELKDILEKFVTQNSAVRVALFGAGNLGSAIIRYPGFQSTKIKLVVAFDNDKSKIGKKINDIKIFSVKDAPRIIRQYKVSVGVIAVPAQYAQEITDVMVLCGLNGIINFSPTTVQAPKGVIVKDIDLTIEFLSLFCDINH